MGAAAGVERGTATVEVYLAQKAAEKAATVSYSDKICLQNILCSKDVQLIKPEYFVYLHTHDLRMPKCQDVPKEWILDVDVELDWGSLEIISVSYCWIAKHHPDPDGYHLQTLFHLCSRFVAGSPHTAKDRYHWSVAGRKLNAPAKYLMDREYMRAGYDASGWPTFERCIAGIISGQHKMQLIDERGRNDLETAGGDYMQLSLEFCDRAREAPITPEAFNELVQDKIFTEGSDKDEIVIPRYRDTFMTTIGDATELQMEGLGFCDPQAREVMKLVRTYGRVKSLNLSGNSITVPLEDWAALALDKKLTSLDLSLNKQLSGNITVVQPLVNLTVLKLYGTQVTGDIEALHTLVNLTDLRLHNMQVTGDIEALHTLVNLTVLKLYNTQVTGDIMALQPLARLTEVYLYNTQVNGDIQAVEPLINLSVLYMYNTQVMGDIAALQPLVNLTALHLHETKVKGDIRAVERLVKLTDLRLHNTQVSGDIEIVKSLVNLTVLSLGGTQVSGDKAAVRDAWVDRRGSPDGLYF